MADVTQSVADIRATILGLDVRASIANGIEDINTEVVSTTGRQDMIEGQFTDVITNATATDPSSVEIVASRLGEVDLPTKIGKIDTSLANMTNQLDTIQINLKYPFPPMVGLKCDGVTDDAPALQNIINYVKANLSGAVLKLTGERIYLASTINIPTDAKNITFEGISNNAYTGSIFQSALDIPLFNVLGLHIKFKNLAFKNTKGTLVRGYDAWGTGIVLGDEVSANPDECEVENCAFFNMTYGVRTKCQNAHIKNNLFSFMRTAGVFLEGRAIVTETDTNGFGLDYYNRNIEVVNNRFHGCNDCAILGQINNVHKEVLIANNQIDDCARGIVGMFIRSSIDGNILGRIRNHGIYVDNTGFDESISILNNVIIGISHNLAGDAVAPSTSAFNYETGDGIHLTSKSAKINNNTIMHKAGNGILVGANSEGTQIYGNTIINADNYNTTTHDAIANASNSVAFDGNNIKRTTAIGKQRYAINNSGAGCYFGAGNQYGSTSGTKAFNDTVTSSVGYASNLGMYRKILYGGSPATVTTNLQKGDRWINVMATATGDVTEYQFDGTAWKAISVLSA